jgi:hypothetical protein
VLVASSSLAKSLSKNEKTPARAFFGEMTKYKTIKATKIPLILRFDEFL